MLKTIANWILSGLALYIVSKIVPGVRLEDFWSALIAIVVIGLANVLVKPLLFILTLPITLLTLGLFTFVINALMLLLASALVPGFKVDGFISALIGSIVLSLLTTLFQALTRS
jgi:putative membrane protein